VEVRVSAADIVVAPVTAKVDESVVASVTAKVDESVVAPVTAKVPSVEILLPIVVVAFATPTPTNAKIKADIAIPIKRFICIFFYLLNFILIKG